MAVTLKRKRGAVSYREQSSNEDISDSASDTVSRRKRTAPVRRSARHQSTGAEPPSRGQRRPPSPHSPATSREMGGRRVLRREGKRQISYRDASSEDDGDDFRDEDLVGQRRPSPSTPQPSRPHKSRKSERKLGRSSGARSQKSLGAPLKPQSTPRSTSVPAQIPTDGHRPAWATLPYHVLLQVFVYASHPLHDEDMKPTPSISWLAQVARMCSAFTKPALTALYRNPPIFATRQNRRDLVQHLTTPPADAYADYRVMVKRLELDATQMTSSTDPTHNATDLAALVAALTTVREIDILDPFDRPPYRARVKRVRRWHYPDELFDVLQQSDLRLRSWRWNSSFCAKGFSWIKEIHKAPTFQSIRELTLTKFVPDKIRKSDDESRKPTTEDLVGIALAALPSLKFLTFESCEVVNERLLPLLPAALRCLNITNCIYLTSDALQAFLATHGQHLEELVLNHNQSLNLTFLTDLKLSCPRLEVLRTDLNYYSSLEMSSDNEPLYDSLLDIDEIPTWPFTLRVIDMEYLRHWSPTAATNFFSSLIDSAEDLPGLRELRILAMVDIDWRQRADFRRKWAARFVKVFARRYIAPSAHLVSLRAYREWKLSQFEGAEKHDSLLEVSEEVERDEAAASDSDVPLLPGRKQKHNERWSSNRLRNRAHASANYDETSASGSGSDVVSDEDDKPDYIQGQCHTVIFRIDNLRPREDLYDEGDFLDEERSGDEDWDGNDVVEDGYAW
ncbi:hypothetical protein K458DRAFT_293069 [Lentithecium fluviatile CBS 122367]|uniref:Uncharacterized protein n=1 Tax=Lentithecium fluviatile CBS 122367 TaxID=1168545 RepID=A0A6G1JDS3_9PLEO|nr:hypothetical protein K458DRAFT_293069 [Lentithecium fluviatile CBS 122367]